ncbi:MAG: transporter related, partial [Lacunisphaera sp.]|nr:transporter related [Lacunisphaera sp.]
MTIFAIFRGKLPWRRPANPVTALLQLDKATIRFGGLTAVNAFDFAVNDNELIGLIGPNGAGK